MQRLIQNLGAKGAPRHPRKSLEFACLRDFLRWLGAPFAPRFCMSSCINRGQRMFASFDVSALFKCNYMSPFEVAFLGGYMVLL